MSKKKHIAFVSGGIHYNLFNRKSAIDSILCSILSELSHTYHITVNGEPFDRLQEEARQKTSDQVAHVRLSGTSGIKKLVPSRIKNMLRDLKLFSHHRQVINKLKAGEKPDLVFELLKHGSNIGAKVSSHFNVPYLVYYDSPANTQFREIYGFKPFFARRIDLYEKQSVRQADRVIVYSTPVRDHLVNFADVDQDKFRIFQTLDYSRLKFMQRKTLPEIPSIGFIGSFMKWHRVDLLLESFNRLRTEGFSCRLLLVGAGEEYESISALIEQSPYKSDIELPGFVDGAMLEGYKSRIDIGVMPGSNWYGIPTKVFEYGAAGTVAVGPSTPTISDIFIHRKNILLFENNHADGLYRNLKELLGDKILFESLRSNLQQLITEKYTAEKAMAFYTTLVEECLSGKPGQQ